MDRKTPPAFGEDTARRIKTKNPDGFDSIGIFRGGDSGLLNISEELSHPHPSGERRVRGDR